MSASCNRTLHLLTRRTLLVSFLHIFRISENHLDPPLLIKLIRRSDSPASRGRHHTSCPPRTSGQVLTRIERAFAIGAAAPSLRLLPFLLLRVFSSSHTACQSSCPSAICGEFPRRRSQLSWFTAALASHSRVPTAHTQWRGVCVWDRERVCGVFGTEFVH